MKLYSPVLGPNFKLIFLCVKYTMLSILEAMKTFVNGEKDQNGSRAYTVLEKRELYYGGQLHNDVVFIGIHRYLIIYLLMKTCFI